MQVLRLIVGFPASGEVDIVARESAEWFRVAHGDSVMIEEQVGAGVLHIALTSVLAIIKW